jgi:isoleucyl-tRNA synthetase
MGLAARAQAKLKVRQPLRTAIIVATGAEREAIERLGDLVRDELNVHELRFVSEADELGRVELKPNYRTLGPRFGAQMPMVAAAVAGLDGAHVAATLREGGTVAIDVGGTEHVLAADDLLVTMQALEGYQVERQGLHAVALDVEIDDALRGEGWARDAVRAIQNARQSAGLEISDRIALTLDGDQELLDAVRTHQGYVAGEVLATTVSYGDLDGTVDPVMIDGRLLKIAITVS